MLSTLDRGSPDVARPVGWLLAVAIVAAVFLPTLDFVASAAAAPDQPSDEQAESPRVNQATTTATEDQKVFRAELPGGAVVEILGVGEHPSKGKPWWSASGEPIEAPYARATANVSGHRALVRELAIKVTQPDGVNVQWELEPNGSAGGGTPLDAHGRTVGDMTARAQAFPGDAKTCTMRIGLASGSWKDLAETTGREQMSMGKQVDGFRYGFAFTPAHEQAAATILTFGDNIQGQDVRVAALDGRGNTLATKRGSRNGASDFSLTTVNFANFPLAKIEKFRIEARPYHWFEIRDISLHPGQKTEPKLVPLER